MQIIAKIVSMNTSDGMINLAVVDEENNAWNLKANVENQFQIGHIYFFDVQKNIKERISYSIVQHSAIEDLDVESYDQILRKFYPGAPLSLQDAKKYILNVVDHMQNEVIKNITKSLLTQFEKKYFIYPAASRMHHTYVGGLAYHTYGMLNLAKTFIQNYPYLQADYLHAGIILHDLGKTSELTGIESTEYTVDGQLLGHLVIGALEIGKTAERLGYGIAKEVRALEHMLISHHGQPQFGAAKRPMTPEAVALWYIDTIDSKFRVLGEELEKTELDHFTDTIGVLDKVRILKE